jgi:hypothetical protein
MPAATMKREILIGLGFASVGMGVLGIVLPLLPTTPFLLLAAYLFARSSGRWHRWLLNHRTLGPYVHAFRNRTGLTRTQKLRIGASFTVLMTVSILLAPQAAVKTLLCAIWVFWSIVLLRMKTAQSETRDRPPAA